MNPRFFNWIWHVKGSLALAPEQSTDEAFEKLAPLFRQTGTSHKRTGDSISFRKVDPAAQDKMSVFDGGVLQIERGAAGPVLHYNLTSRALMFCFFAPLLFLAFAQLTIFKGKFDKPSVHPASNAEVLMKAEKESALLIQNPIDKALGAPAPVKPGKDKGTGDKKSSPKAAYIFAGIFAALYVIGRLLEARLVGSLFRTKLL
ncbi:hypothetical protein [Novosphingobium gossypii]|uniref:hypothetical protein n=1 Tax=Novosphingobium gossypii TaxID=1604774 RepID=UPI003D1B86F0